MKMSYCFSEVSHRMHYGTLWKFWIQLTPCAVTLAPLNSPEISLQLCPVYIASCILLLVQQGRSAPRHQCPGVQAAASPIHSPHTHCLGWVPTFPNCAGPGSGLGQDRHAWCVSGCEQSEYLPVVCNRKSSGVRELEIWKITQMCAPYTSCYRFLLDLKLQLMTTGTIPGNEDVETSPSFQ